MRKILFYTVGISSVLLIASVLSLVILKDVQTSLKWMLCIVAFLSLSCVCLIACGYDFYKHRDWIYFVVNFLGYVMIISGVTMMLFGYSQNNNAEINMFSDGLTVIVFYTLVYIFKIIYRAVSIKYDVLEEEK